jgi:hypothetical protein
MSKRKWLWLEDELSSVSDIRNFMDRNYVTFEPFSNFDDFYLRLVDLKKAGKLHEYGLILDIKIDAVKFVPLPKEWSGDGEFKNIRVESEVNNTGLVFYENAILEYAKDFWDPLPPVIFLSTVLESVFKLDLDRIKTKNPYVAFVRKWDYDDTSTFLTYLNEW